MIMARDGFARGLRVAGALLLGACAAAPAASTGASLECMLVNASTVRPPDWVDSIGEGSVSDSAEDWQETWTRLTGRAELPAKPLPPGMKAIAVTEKPGESCYSYIAVRTYSRAGGRFGVEFHLRDISALAGPTGSVCLPGVAQRSLVLFVPAELAREVRFVRSAPVAERAPRASAPPCPVLQRV